MSEQNVEIVRRFMDAMRGKAKAGGAPIGARMFDVFTLREGQIVRLEEYTDRGQALEAAGLMSSTP